MLINKDRENDHEMNITFRDAEQRHALHLNEPVERITFSAAKYQWREGENGNLAEPEGPLQKPRCRAGRTLCIVTEGNDYRLAWEISESRGWKLIAELLEVGPRLMMRLEVLALLL